MNSIYHDHPAASSTRLKAAITGTARRYWAQHVDPQRQPFQPTDAMRQGSLVDLLITQPERFDSVYMVAGDGRTKEGKALRAAALEQGLEPVSADWVANASRIRDTLLSDPHTGPILRDAVVTSQEPHYWTDSQGRECRYLPDIETAAGGLWDLKKARSAARRSVINQAYQLAYDIQLAHYMLGYSDRHGRPPVAVGLICYEWDYPHDCSVMEATPEFLAKGLVRREQAFARIAEWAAAGEWPSHGCSPLEPPAWLTDPAVAEPESIELF